MVKCLIPWYQSYWKIFNVILSYYVNAYVALARECVLDKLIEIHRFIKNYFDILVKLYHVETKYLIKEKK